MKMQNVPKLDRPREKLERYGVGRLDDHELIAIILGSGVKGANVMQLSKKILSLIKKDKHKNIDVESLKKIHGLGGAKSSQIIAALELGHRIYSIHPRILITSKKVSELCVDIRDSKREHFVAFYVNSRNELIAQEIISIGTLDASLVDPKSIFEPALKHAAAGIFIAHNHPSGDSEPSNEDILITERLKQAGRLIGIKLIDHVIVTKTSSRSLI